MSSWHAVPRMSRLVLIESSTSTKRSVSCSLAVLFGTCRASWSSAHCWISRIRTISLKWAAAALAVGARRHTLNFVRQRGEVNMLRHHPQRIAQLVQLGFALLVGKQTGPGHGNYVSIGVLRSSMFGLIFRGAQKLRKSFTSQSNDRN
jgi:hypothetical protein